MKPKEIRKMSDDELAEQLAETREELFNLRFQDATGALDNTAQLGVTKRHIARILTVQTEREHNLERG
ncbi:MAG: 50S ribosomal protein L29 [Gaiellaceae bacterium]